MYSNFSLQKNENIDDLKQMVVKHMERHNNEIRRLRNRLAQRPMAEASYFIYTYTT